MIYGIACLLFSFYTSWCVFLLLVSPRSIRYLLHGDASRSGMSLLFCSCVLLLFMLFSSGMIAVQPSAMTAMKICLFSLGLIFYMPGLGHGMGRRAMIAFGI